MSEHDSELQVVSRSRDGRRRYDEKGKRALVEAALRPGMSVARLAQEHGVNANLLRKWITKYLLERECKPVFARGNVPRQSHRSLPLPPLALPKTSTCHDRRGLRRAVAVEHARRPALSRRCHTSELDATTLRGVN